jgi:hypothetical protein
VPTPALPADWPLMEYTGTLMHQAEARVRTNPAGTQTPTLCLFLELDNATHTTLQVEQPFPVGHFQQVEAAARRLKQGTRVSVQAPLVGMRLVARNAAHIHIINPATKLLKEAP